MGGYDNSINDAEERVAKIKANNRLEDIVERYGISLKSSLATNGNGVVYVGLCPLHQEKTASFFVYSDKQNYHCYGCGSHGDVIHFVQEMEKCTFREALEKLGLNDLNTKEYERHIMVKRI